MSIREAVTSAVSEHPDILRARANLEADKRQIDIEKAGYYPSVDLSTEGGYQKFQSENDYRLRPGFTFTITQPLFTGFFTRFQVRGAEFTAQASQERLRETRENKALEAAQAYLEVYRTRESQKIATKNLDRHNELSALVIIRAEQGAGTEADVLQAKVRTDAATVRFNETEDEVAKAEATFLQQIGSMPGPLTFETVEGPPVPDTLSGAFQQARSKNPALSAVEASELAAKENIGANKASFYPTVDIELSKSRFENTRGNEGDEDETKAILLLSWNLYAGGADVAKSRRAVALLNETIAGKKSLNLQLKQQITQDLSFLETTRENVPLLANRTAESERLVERYNQQFQVGGRTLLDLLNAENELFQARIDLLDGQVRIEFAKYRVYNTLGSLLDVFNIASGGSK